MKPLYEAFEEQTGIRVVTRQLPWEELYDQLVIAIAAGSGPDVTAVSEWAPRLAHDGAFEDLTPWLRQSERLRSEDLLPNVLEMWRLPGGAQFAMPFDIDLNALFYNEEMFNRVGLAYPDERMTWEELLETARFFTVDRDEDGEYDQYGFSNGHIFIEPLIWAYGGELLNPAGDAPALHTPQARRALELYKALGAEDASMPWEAASRFGYPHPPAAFSGDLIAMYPLGAWAPSSLWQDRSTGRWLALFNVTHLPAAPSGQRATLLSGQGLAVLARSPNKEAAWAFVEHMLSPDVQRVSAAYLGQFPVLRTVALSEAFALQDQPPRNKMAFVEATVYARPHPRTRNWDEAWRIMREELNRYFNGNEPLGAVLDTLNRRTRSVLAGA